LNGTQDAELLAALKTVLKVHGTLLLLVSTRRSRAFFVHSIGSKRVSSCGFRISNTYVVMPSTDRPVFIVPWSGRISRDFFRREARSPYNSWRHYTIKWLLATCGVAQFLQRGFVLVCTND
jgi:hypothetical protein